MKAEAVDLETRAGTGRADTPRQASGPRVDAGPGAGRADSGSGGRGRRGPGLRERKKAQTRSELRAGAARLFADQGFHATTVADIAAAANVSERTFFRYFDGKEALLLPDPAELFARIEAELAARPAREEPLEAVCAALLAAAGPLAAPAGGAPARGTDGAGGVTPDGGPVAVDLLVQAFDGFEDRLTELVAARLPRRTPDRDLHAAVVACACLSTVRAILRTQSVRGAADGAVPEPAALLPAALGILSRIGTGAGPR